jgi:hypothetical protein
METSSKDEILRLAGVELEAEAALGADRTSLAAAAELGSAPEAAVQASAVPTPQTGISIPMVATPRFVRKVPEDGMEHDGTMEIYGTDTWNWGKHWGFHVFF